MSEERKCDKCAGCAIVSQQLCNAMRKPDYSCYIPEDRDTIQSLATANAELTAQLGEAREALDVVVYDTDMKRNRWGLWSKCKQALSRTPSSALARYKALEELAKAVDSLECFDDLSQPILECGCTPENPGPFNEARRRVHDAAKRLQEVPHANPTD
jgi:hypothetical protein